jgi:hypothetical protein
VRRLLSLRLFDIFCNSSLLDILHDNRWIRLGYDPLDNTTWVQERIHMPRLRHELVQTFSPKALVSLTWPLAHLLCDTFSGGELCATYSEKTESMSHPHHGVIGAPILSYVGLANISTHSFIMNLGTHDSDLSEVAPGTFTQWHCDGKSFQVFPGESYNAPCILNMQETSFFTSLTHLNRRFS